MSIFLWPVKGNATFLLLKAVQEAARTTVGRLLTGAQCVGSTPRAERNNTPDQIIVFADCVAHGTFSALSALISSSSYSSVSTAIGLRKHRIPFDLRS